MFRIISFLKFFFNSKNEHGVHSPFVYDFITKGVYTKNIPPELWKTYLTTKNELLKNSKTLDVKDFGAGSKTTKSSKRSTKQIARSAGIRNKRAKVLFQITQYVNPQHILELGTSLGLSTTILALSAPKASITTIEGCPNLWNIANHHFQKNNLSNIHSLCGNFDTELPLLLKKQSFDLVFIDGNHTKKATLNYFNTLLKSSHNNSCFIFDDIYWSKGMNEAWDIIKNHPSVSVSIDTYQWGIVFFRKEQRKEHFTIRI